MNLNKSNPVPAIPRSLSESPDYPPDWRHQTVQHYRVDIDQNTDPSEKLAQIWKAEPDKWVLQLLLFHYGGPCLIEPAVRYAVSCWRGGQRTGALNIMKALVVASVEPEKIGEINGTDPFNIYMFEWLYFDIRDCPGKDFLVRRICSRAADPGASAEVRAEARLLEIALNRGPEGIITAVFGKGTSNPGDKSGRSSMERALKIGLGRAGDYLIDLDASGKPPTKEDLKAIPVLLDLEELYRKVGREDPPKPHQSENYLPPAMLYDWMNSAAKGSVFTTECILHPSRSHLEQFLQLPIFQTQLRQEASGTKSACSRLQATLKQAIAIWQGQQQTLNSQWTYWLYNELAKMAAIEAKNDPSFSPASQPVIGKISWSKLFKELTSPRPN